MDVVLARHRSQPSEVSNLRRVNIFRFVLPLALFLLATGFEFWDHWTNDEVAPANWLGLVEVMVFGILGPLAVFAVLTYVVVLLRELERMHAHVTTLNQDLEQIVVQRTLALQASNEELAQVNRRLYDIDQMKSDFVALVSHELRAPLATLNGGLEVALQHADDLSLRSRRVLDLMMGETQRLTQFVQTVLDVSQLEAGKLRLTCGPLAVKPMLWRAVEIVFGSDDPRIIWQLPSNLPPIWADETYAEEAFRNLLRNAQKYTPPQSPIELAAMIDDRYIRICVIDHGPGIPPEAQDRIFERFYRAGQNGDHASHGWGLGLHFARSLLVAQGASLRVESPAHPDPDAPGSRFVAELLIAEEAQDYGKFTAD